MEYDPLTGSALPVYENTSAPPPGPFTGDSGYKYGSDVLKLLQFGVGQYAETQRAKISSQERVELGRGGLAQVGQPIGTVGGVQVSPLMILLGLVVVGGVIYAATR